MSTLFVNNLNTASGSTITVPTGKQLIVTDEGGVRVPGNVLQTVFAEHESAVNVNSAGYINSGLTATITPKSTSSKILINVSMSVSVRGLAGHDAGLGFRILRGGSAIWTSTTSYRNYIYVGTTSSSSDFRGTDTIIRLDSPSSTSALTYSIQGVGYNAGSNSNIFMQTDGNHSSIILMEIAQ